MRSASPGAPTLFRRFSFAGAGGIPAAIAAYVQAGRRFPLGRTPFRLMQTVSSRPMWRQRSRAGARRRRSPWCRRWAICVPISRWCAGAGACFARGGEHFRQSAAVQRPGRFSDYPRSLQADAAALSGRRPICCSRPWPKTFIPTACATARIQVPAIADELCGAFRPGHFAGMATVVRSCSIWCGRTWRCSAKRITSSCSSCAAWSDLHLGAHRRCRHLT